MIVIGPAQGRADKRDAVGGEQPPTSHGVFAQTLRTLFERNGTSSPRVNEQDSGSAAMFNERGFFAQRPFVMAESAVQEAPSPQAINLGKHRGNDGPPEPEIVANGRLPDQIDAHHPLADEVVATSHAARPTPKISGSAVLAREARAVGSISGFPRAIIAPAAKQATTTGAENLAEVGLTSGERSTATQTRKPELVVTTAGEGGRVAIAVQAPGLVGWDAPRLRDEVARLLAAHGRSLGDLRLNGKRLSKQLWEREGQHAGGTS